LFFDLCEVTSSQITKLFKKILQQNKEMLIKSNSFRHDFRVEQTEKVSRLMWPVLLTVVFGVMLLWLGVNTRYPLHDITTDLDSPIQFIESRKRTVNSTYDLSLKEVQQRLHPEIKPLYIKIGKSRPIDQVLMKLWDVTKKNTDWELQALDREQFRIQVLFFPLLHFVSLFG